MKNSKQWLAVILVLGLVVVLASLSGTSAQEFSQFVDEQGNISNPGNVRSKWTHIGSFIVPRESDDGYGFHDVYARQSTIEAYQETGQFPDGAVLVRELHSIDSSKTPSGMTFWAGEFLDRFVMIKDRQKRFQDNPHWGDGWAWAHFKPENPEVNVSENYEDDCMECHTSARTTDYVTIKGYPALR